MAKVLDDLQAAVTNETSVVQAAILLINGFSQRLADAVAKALENGATEEELAPVQAEVDALNASATALGSAVAANTPAGPATPSA